MRKNSRLLNLHNMGIHFKILVIVNLFAMFSALVLSDNLSDFFQKLANISMLVQPTTLFSIVSLGLIYPILNKLRYWQSILAISIMVILSAWLTWFVLTYILLLDNITNPYRTCFFALLASSVILYYFSLQQRAYSPAIAEARLQALQARIRPHFLFNSINAVLSLIRSQPKRAEAALEDLSDLFRVLMGENRDLVPISNEIALCRQYLNIESLRLEERLKVKWELDKMPEDALIPPLILQPLIENAVYHGIEPLPTGGEISINIYTKNKELFISISNPISMESGHQTGNKMALKNIKERLALHFDLEASLSHEVKNQHYVVFIRLPYSTH